MGTQTCLVLLLCLMVTSPVLCARRRQSQRSSDTCVDMTRSMIEGMHRFPKLQAFLLNVTTKDIEDSKFQIEVMTTSTHMGTHMDAPRHFNANGITIDQIPIQNFNGVPAYVVDVRNETNRDSSYEIQVSDIEDWQKSQNTTIANRSLIIFRTGWGDRWPDTKRFLGTDQDDPDQLKFPGISPSAATWLSEHAIAGVGTECVSVDPDGESTKTAHRIILNSPHSLYILENLANVDLLPAKGAKVYAFPMKIENASGAPARVIACFRQKPSPSTRSSSRSARRRQH